jgi:hypothetical protein
MTTTSLIVESGSCSLYRHKFVQFLMYEGDTPFFCYFHCYLLPDKVHKISPTLHTISKSFELYESPY